MNAKSHTSDQAFDVPTVLAVAAMCYLATVLIHEGVGHAGTTMLVGGRVLQVTSAACDCDVSHVSQWAARAVAAGGCVANVITGLAALALIKVIRRERTTLRYAVWLFGHVSLFVPAGYLMVFPFLPAGDWHDFLIGMPGTLAWQVGLTLLGIAGYVAAMWHAQRSLEEFLGGPPETRQTRARDLTLWPYLIGGVVETLSSIVGGGGILVLISAAPATFGGTIGLAMAGWRAGKSRRTESSAAVRIPRSPVLIALGVAAILFHLFWLGPGLIRPFSGRS